MMSKRICFVTLVAIILIIFALNSNRDKNNPKPAFRFPIGMPWEGKDKICISMEEAVKGANIISKQDDSNLLRFIRDKQLIKPASTEPYNLSHPEIVDTSMGQSAMILPALNNMTNGFFVECGALDGETRSNTLYMEKELGWTGLLIEGDPKNYQLVLEKQRKAWTINACLATYPYPHEVTFLQQFNVGRISSDSNKGTSKRRKRSSSATRVQCFPLFTLLSALNVKTVDYFSLDIEGDEMKVLRNIPFDKIFIKTLSVEFIHGEGKGPLKKLMEEKGYRLLGTVVHDGGLANDLLFIHNSLQTNQ